MKKGMCVLTVVALLAGGAAFAAPNPTGLPKVPFNAQCSYLLTIDNQANVLMALLAGFITGLPPYAQVDLEASNTGDGIPDNIELALLAEALCAGDADLIAQFNSNKAVYSQLVADVTLAVNIILGPPRVDARLADVANIIAGHPELMAVPEIAAVQAELAHLATQLTGLLDQITPDIIALIPGIEQQLPGFSDVAVALAGLSTEMQSTVVNLLNQYLTDIQADILLAQQAITAAQGIVALQPPILTPTEITTVTGVINDASALIPAVQRTAALPSNLHIYGVFKSASEPFSGPGDYDGDGNTNLETYNALKACGKNTRADFIPAASGLNPFWCGNPGMPVVGMFGLFALAGAVALGGLRSIRRK